MLIILRSFPKFIEHVQLFFVWNRVNVCKHTKNDTDLESTVNLVLSPFLLNIYPQQLI